MAEFDVVVIGAGPGGYVAAIRAAQLGFNTACVEKEKALGGTCLRVGCIPSKALLEASEQLARAKHQLGPFGVKVGAVELDLATMMKHKDRVVQANTRGVDGLFAKNKVRRYLGTARLVAPGQLVVVDGDGSEEQLSAEHIVVATGSTVATLPGVELDGDRIGTSSEALAYASVPERLIVIGAGAIGLEMGSVWSRLGAKVTVLEFLPRILPGIDAELAEAARKILLGQGLEIRLSCRVEKAELDGDSVVVTYRDDEGDEQTARGDRVLVAVGRKPNTEGLGADEVGLEMDDKGRIVVDDDFNTSVDGVYAIGDVIRGPMLAHKASEEGVALVERLATGYGHVNYDAVPNVVYTEPEIAQVGRSEDELEADGVPFKKGTYPFRFNGRARALRATDGFVKVLAHAETDRLLGVCVIGSRAGDLIAEAATAIEMMACAEDIARGCHAHPTLAEALKEAALDVDGRAIHK